MLSFEMLVNSFVLHISILAFRTFQHFWKENRHVKIDRQENRQIDKKIDSSFEKKPLSNTLERRIEQSELADQRDDEVIKMLCDYENGFPLLLGRVKESMNSTKDAATFLRKRAQIEQDYASQLMKLGSSYKNSANKNNFWD
jgi:hypothetical protein